MIKNSTSKKALFQLLMSISEAKNANQKKNNNKN